MKAPLYLLLMILPKFSVADTIGFLEGSSTIRIFREYLPMSWNFTGRHFWDWGYCVSTFGLDEQMFREHIKSQEPEEKRQKQMRLTGSPRRISVFICIKQWEDYG